MDPQNYDIVKLIYSSVLNDIRFIKEQQWKITNYGLLAFAAIYSFFNMITDYISNLSLKSCFVIILVLVLLLVAVVLLCTWLLSQSKKDYELAIYRKEKCKKEFPVYFLTVMQPRDLVDKKAFLDKIMIMFYSILTFAAILVFILIAVKLYSVQYL